MPNLRWTASLPIENANSPAQQFHAVMSLIPARPHVVAEPCIRCGWCAQTYPTVVQPAGLLEAAQRKDLAMADRFGLGACMECGICSYMCPSHLPLLQGIRVLKGMEGA
jgi:Na+-translocating ferredoxin:NAD+ oxidoreductase RnfC subunit